MKKQYKKTMGAILATLSMVGAVHADNNRIQVEDGGVDTKVIIQQLVSQGYLLPLQEENWYQINQEKLDSLERSYDRDRATKIVNLLQTLVGQEANVRLVDVFKARMSSQDYPGKGQ